MVHWTANKAIACMNSICFHYDFLAMPDHVGYWLMSNINRQLSSVVWPEKNIWGGGGPGSCARSM